MNKLSQLTHSIVSKIISLFIIFILLSTALFARKTLIVIYGKTYILNGTDCNFLHSLVPDIMFCEEMIENKINKTSFVRSSSSKVSITMKNGTTYELASDISQKKMEDLIKKRDKKALSQFKYQDGIISNARIKRILKS